jgi:anti-sigma regulatory factor (Ser/Thr protein kinase)
VSAGAAGDGERGPPHPTFLEVRIGARLPAVRILNDLLDVTLRAVGVDEGTRHDLTLGVAELIANVVEHEGGTGEVGLRLDVLPRDLRLTVSSSGAAFDLDGAIARARDRDPLESDTEGGLGLPMLVALFDEVRLDHHVGQGNRITLRKAR